MTRLLRQFRFVTTRWISATLILLINPRSSIPSTSFMWHPLAQNIKHVPGTTIEDLFIILSREYLEFPRRQMLQLTTSLWRCNVKSRQFFVQEKQVSRTRWKGKYSQTAAGNAFDDYLRWTMPAVANRGCRCWTIANNRVTNRTTSYEAHSVSCRVN